MTDVTPTAPDPATPVPAPSAAPPAGWYDDGSGRQRWFDGVQWTNQFAPTAPPAHTTGPMTSGSLNVKREVSYVRQQQGHSIILHIFLIFVIIGMFTVPYYSLSPNHYWHA